MNIIFHPEAIKNFNKRANQLLYLLKPKLSEDEKKYTSDTGIITIPLNEEEILDSEIIYATDYSGKIVSKFFDYNDQTIGLYHQDFFELQKLAEDIQKSGGLYEKLGTEFIYDIIFKWIQLKYSGTTNEEMMHYFNQQCDKKIKYYEIWIPIANTIIEGEIKLGNVIIKNLSQEFFDNWENESLKNAKDKFQKENIIERVENERVRNQGFAVCIVNVEAEKDRAMEIAFEKVEEALDVIRIFSPSAFLIDLKSYSTVKGRENLEWNECYIIENEILINTVHSTLDKSDVMWRISKEFIAEYENEFLNLVNELLLKENRNSFQEKVLNSIRLYSRSTLMKSIPDKLVYIFASVESILLKNDTEPIQQNVADRIAYAIAKDGNERINIVKNIKQAYSFRSKFVHHGLGITDFTLLNEFIKHILFFIYVLLGSLNTFRTKEEFIEFIERKKYGI